MKKIISLLLVVLIICTMCCGVASAAEPRWANVVTITPLISASSDEFGLTIFGVSGTTKIQCDMTLYKKGLFGETPVGHRSSIYLGQGQTFFSSAVIDEGSTYRLDATLVVTANGHAETIEYEYEKTC